MSSATVAGDSGEAPAAAAPPMTTWADESIERYTNPIAFARKNTPTPTPELQNEVSLAVPGGKNAKLEIHLLKERSFWSKVSLFWTFRLADVEGDDNAEQMVVALVFDSWTGSIEISENAIVKVDEIQKPIMGGSWITKTDFGRLEIKIVPYWTGEIPVRALARGEGGVHVLR
ncbi:unnamed protein product, partial [Ectocarpus sp. 13 AM-2016]